VRREGARLPRKAITLHSACVCLAERTGDFSVRFWRNILAQFFQTVGAARRFGVMAGWAAVLTASFSFLYIAVAITEPPKTTSSPPGIARPPQLPPRWTHAVNMT